MVRLTSARHLRQRLGSSRPLRVDCLRGNSQRRPRGWRASRTLRARRTRPLPEPWQHSQCTRIAESQAPRWRRPPNPAPRLPPQPSHRRARQLLQHHSRRTRRTRSDPPRWRRPPNPAPRLPPQPFHQPARRLLRHHKPHQEQRPRTQRPGRCSCTRKQPSRRQQAVHAASRRPRHQAIHTASPCLLHRSTPYCSRPRHYRLQRRKKQYRAHQRAASAKLDPHRRAASAKRRPHHQQHHRPLRRQRPPGRPNRWHRQQHRQAARPRRAQQCSTSAAPSPARARRRRRCLHHAPTHPRRKNSPGGYSSVRRPLRRPPSPLPLPDSRPGHRRRRQQHRLRYRRPGQPRRQ
jgi:hypothetical protein